MKRKDFLDRDGCLHYEFKLSLQDLDKITMYDDYGEVCSDIFREDTYFNCEKIVLESNGAVNSLNRIGEYFGWSEWTYMNKIGTYARIGSPFANPWEKID